MNSNVSAVSRKALVSFFLQYTLERDHSEAFGEKALHGKNKERYTSENWWARMKFGYLLFRLEPIHVLLISCILGLTAYFSFFLCLHLHIHFRFLVIAFLYLVVNLFLVFQFGKWKELITISVLGIFLFQFGFREEMEELYSLREKTNESHPINQPSKEDPFLFLSGYQFSTNGHFTKSIHQKSRDHKGRDNSHTSHYVLIPIVNKERPSERVRFLYVAPNYFLYHRWRERNVFPNFARLEKETPELVSVTKEWENQFPNLKKEKIIWVNLYESKEDYIESKSSFFLLLTFILPGLWCSVGLVWGIRLVFRSLLFHFRS